MWALYMSVIYTHTHKCIHHKIVFGMHLCNHVKMSCQHKHLQVEEVEFSVCIRNIRVAETVHSVTETAF